jgi:hypothetical protein
VTAIRCGLLKQLLNLYLTGNYKQQMKQSITALGAANVSKRFTTRWSGVIDEGHTSVEPWGDRNLRTALIGLPEHPASSSVYESTGVTFSSAPVHLALILSHKEG